MNREQWLSECIQKLRPDFGGLVEEEGNEGR
jgi:hypothetical protein